MKRQLSGYAVEVRSEGPVTFLASTYNQARDGLVIEPGAWDLKAYQQNPVVLLNHDYSSLPIGKAKNVRETAQGLVTDIEFDMDDPRAVEARRKVAKGFINSVSVGWTTLQQEGNRVKRAELFDISLVSVPADPGAIALARSAYQKHITGTPGDLRAIRSLLIDFEEKRQARDESDRIAKANKIADHLVAEYLIERALTGHDPKGAA